MSVIGQYIKKYRTAKGITQEQLGQLVGVSTQAVSKWECGGTPDVELLPAIADLLGVSIDALFGREDEDIAVSIKRKIFSLSREEAFRFAFSLCWGICHGMMFSENNYDEFLARMPYLPRIDDGQEGKWARIMHDEGMVSARFTPGFQHFFLQLEPEGGLTNQLLPPEKLREVFAVLADEKLLKLIYSLYSRLNTPLAASLIGEKTGMTVQEVDRCMEILCSRGFATRTPIAVAGGEMYAYMFNQEHAVVPLLCFADELARNDTYVFMWSFDRTKPLMPSTDG